VNLAPNGKPSNLTAQQYDLVRTKAFKDWFGDWENDSANASKVVDENGEPKVVYHGTRSDDFYEFQNKLFGYRGFYFTDKKSVARNYGSNIRQFFLNSKNFISEDMKGGNYSDNEWIDDLVENSEMDNKDVHLLNFIDPLDPSSMDRFPISNIYIIFNKSKIKLADGTNTTFDSNNNDIRFDEGGLVGDLFTKKVYIIRLSGGDWFEDYNSVYDKYEDALNDYNKINNSDFERYENSKGLVKTLSEKTLKYKFVAEIDEDDNIDDYTDTITLKNKTFWEIIDDGEWNDLESDSVERINEKADKLLSEVYNYYGRKYNTIYLDEDETISLKLRIADHSGKWKNKGSEDYFLSIVISDKNPTEDFYINSSEGLNREEEEVFSSENTFEEIIKFINEKIKYYKEKSDIRFDDGGKIPKELYHYTSEINFDRIFDSNILNPSQKYGNRLSFTSDSEYHKKEHGLDYGNTNVRITFDNEKLLSDGYLFSPFDHSLKQNKIGKEFEYVISTPIENVKKYIKNITIFEGNAILGYIDKTATDDANKYYFNSDIIYADGGEVKSDYIKKVKEAIKYVENSPTARMQIDFENEEGSKQSINEGKDYERIFPLKSKSNSFIVKKIREGVQDKYDSIGTWNEKKKSYDYKYPKNKKYGDKSKEFDTLQIANYDEKGKIVGILKIATSENKKEDVKKGSFKISVRQDYQNKGIASKLIEKAESEGIDFVEALKNNNFTSKGRWYFKSWLNKKLKNKVKYKYAEGGMPKKETFKSIGSAIGFGTIPMIEGHDMIAECDCGEKFTYQNSKKDILWQCPKCNVKKGF
jgi:GNAT superfamily N-acetyltransferase